MAITIANSGQTPSGATTSLTIASATAGNVLACFICQTATTTAPTMTGYTVNSTGALFASSADSVFLAYKTAAGGETSLAPTAGSGGAITGLAYVELNGASATIDSSGTVTATNNQTTNTTGSASISTATSGSVALLGFGFPSTSGTTSAWTGSDVATTMGGSTAATRMLGGYYVPSGTLSSQSFTANWGTGRTFGILTVAFKPAGNTGNMFALF